MVYVGDRRVLYITTHVTVRVGVEIINRVSGDQFVHLHFVLGVSYVIIDRFRRRFADGISQGAFFAVFYRVDRLRFLQVRLCNIVRPVLRPLQASIRTVTMIVAKGLVFCAIRHGLALVSAIDVASSTYARIKEFTSVVLGKVRAGGCVARLSILVKGRSEGGTSTGIHSTGFRVILITRGMRVNFLSIRFHARVALW